MPQKLYLRAHLQLEAFLYPARGVKIGGFQNSMYSFS